MQTSSGPFPAFQHTRIFTHAMQATETPKVNHPARGLQHVPHHLLWLYQNGESLLVRRTTPRCAFSLVQSFRDLLRLIQRQRSEDPEVGCIFHCHHSPHDYFVPCPNAPQANAESTPAKKRSKVRDPMPRSTILANSCQSGPRTRILPRRKALLPTAKARTPRLHPRRTAARPRVAIPTSSWLTLKATLVRIASAPSLCVILPSFALHELIRHPADLLGQGPVLGLTLFRLEFDPLLNSCQNLAGSGRVQGQHALPRRHGGRIRRRAHGRLSSR